MRCARCPEADVYAVKTNTNEHGRHSLDFLTTIDVAREMSEVCDGAVSESVWLWQLLELSVPDNMMDCITVTARSEMRDWAKQEKESVGDKEAAKVLRALCCKTPRQARRPRGGAAGGRAQGGRGRGLARGSAAEDDSEEEEEELESEDEAVKGKAGGQDHNDEAADPAVEKERKRKGPTRDRVLCEDGAYAGDISSVYGFSAMSVCVLCRFHGCRYMVQSHRTPEPNLLRVWLQASQHCTQAVHQGSFWPTTQIVPSTKGRGSGRGG